MWGLFRGSTQRDKAGRGLEWPMSGWWLLGTGLSACKPEGERGPGRCQEEPVNEGRGHLRSDSLTAVQEGDPERTKSPA